MLKNMNLISGLKRLLDLSNLSYSMIMMKSLPTRIQLKVECECRYRNWIRKIKNLNLSNDKKSLLKRYVEVCPYATSLKDVKDFIQSNKKHGYDVLYGESFETMEVVYMKDGIRVEMMIGAECYIYDLLKLEPYVLFVVDGIPARVSLNDSFFIIHDRDNNIQEEIIQKIISVMNENWYKFVSCYNYKVALTMYQFPYLSREKLFEKMIDTANSYAHNYDELIDKICVYEKSLY